MSADLPLAPRRGALVVLAIMAALFLVLVGSLISGFRKWSEPEPVPVGPSAPGDSRPSTRAAEVPLPVESGFEDRNLALGGNLAAVVADEGKPLDGGWFPDAVVRLTEAIERVAPEELASRAKPIPPLQELFDRPRDHAGEVYAIRFIPFASHPHKRWLDGGSRTRDSWRVYGMLQRDTNEVAMFESFERPPAWTEKRDAYEAVAVFLRSGTYASEKGNRRVPYLLASSYRPLGEADAGPNVGIHRILLSRYGWIVAATLALLVALTVWTVRRFYRQQEKLERDTFYALLRAKKRPVKKA